MSVSHVYGKLQSVQVNPILDGVRAHPILDGGGGKKAPRVNSAI